MIIFKRQRTDNVIASVNRWGEPGNGGAHYRYSLGAYQVDDAGNFDRSSRHWSIKFQQGNMDEEINGILGDQLLAIVADRLRSFQAGPFACDENARMLAHVEAAIACSDERQENRRKRGVAGKLEK